MSITTCQKVTLISCSVLCVSLFLPRVLLPREKKDLAKPEVGPGFYPPVVRQPSFPKDADRFGVDPSYIMTRSAEAMAKVKGIGHGKKYNLMAQVIPIYGFGILLYIIYIIYKLTCKGRTTKSGNCTTVTKANMENKITNNYELARLQKRLLQTEQIMEGILSGKGHGSGSGRRKKSKSTTSKNEEKLLRQLRQITQLMREGRSEGASPEMEAEEVPYGADWEGYPDETFPDYDGHSDSEFDPITLEEPPKQPTPEALAERMEQEEEELLARKLSVVQEEDEEEDDEDDETDVDEVDDEEEEEDNDEPVEEVEDDIEDEEEKEEEKRQLLSPPSKQSAAETKQERVGLEVSKELQGHSGGKKQISFSEHKDVFHYPKQDVYEKDQEEREDEVDEEDEETEVEEEEDAEEDDPVIEAESLQFSCEGCSNPEEEAEENKEEYLLTSAAVEDDSHIEVDTPKEVVVSGLRMRNRRET
ncbi:protein RIC-3 [Channa argus]|uniref:protein RIC-3 n=1 Tax=Channa argus TaxID=215402 RepID=UPI003521C6A1